MHDHFKVSFNEHDCRQLVKDLRKQLVEVKREKEEQITKLDEDVAHCKDQLQELKARTELLNKYIKKQSDVKVQCSQRQQQNKESDLYNERERLKQELAKEKRAHAEIENYLKKHIEYMEREEVVIEHRAMKERQRLKEEQEKKENTTATKLQAWWRGMMVRKGMGPLRKGVRRKERREARKESQTKNKNNYNNRNI
uniref:Dynein regulatory complex protein 9 n=1 Tax=Amphimedon queenslandica TaxID=400682 RepID=A0A1X7SZX8_AMPQE